MAKVIGLRLSAPSPHNKRQTGLLLRSKLKPPAGHHWQANEFTDHGTQTAEGQRLLHRGEHVFFPIALDEDHPVGIKPCLSKCGEEQIRPCQTPDDLTLGACGDTRDEKGRRRTVNGSSASASEFVQCAASKSSTWEHLVDLGDAERQTCRLLRPPSLETGDPLTQICYDVLARSRHRPRKSSRFVLGKANSFMPFSLMRFTFCSDSGRESSSPK